METRLHLTITSLTFQNYFLTLQSHFKNGNVRKFVPLNSKKTTWKMITALQQFCLLVLKNEPKNASRNHAEINFWKVQWCCYATKTRISQVYVISVLVSKLTKSILDFSIKIPQYWMCLKLTLKKSDWPQLTSFICLSC